jgi:site-specific recombinase XerC
MAPVRESILGRTERDGGANARTRIESDRSERSDPSDQLLPPMATLPGLRPLQEPEFIPPMFTREQVRILVEWKPTTFYDRRLSLLILLLLDNGSRISEALGVHTKEISLDDLLLTLTGKGRKQRIVPISMELRRPVFKFI